MKILQKLEGAFDKTITIFAVLAALVVVFMMISVSFNVVLRYFLGRPLLWVFEINELAILYMTFLGTAWVLRREGHVGMDLLFAWVSRRTELFLNIVTSFISAIACLIATLYGVPVTWDYYIKGIYQISLLELPTALFLAIVPIGFFLLFIQFLRRGAGFIIKFKKLGAKTSSRKVQNPQDC